VYKDREKQREAVRRYYDRNRDVYRAKNDRKRARLRQLVIEAKAVPCMDCGQVFPAYVMDFDHREGKESEISVLVNALSLGRLVTEMAKCDVVCANCHRVRTYGQRRGTPLDRHARPRARESPQLRLALWAPDDA
jgi:hypothetical protein